MIKKNLSRWATFSMGALATAGMLQADDAADYAAVDDPNSAVTSALGESQSASVRSTYGRHFEKPRSSFFFAGTEFTFVQAEAATGGSITKSFNDSDTADVDLSITDGNGLTGFAYAPRVWLGYKVGEKWGFAGRFWTLSATESGPPSLTPGTAELQNFATVNETNRLDAYTVDVEGIRSFTAGKWKVDGMVGGRFASYTAQSDILTFGVFTTGNFVNLGLANGCRFDGAGVTYGLSARRPVAESHWSLFVGARGSHLEGTSDSFARSSGAVASSPSLPLVGAATVTRNDADARMKMCEFQLGCEWNAPLRCLPANVFFRTAAEYQYWNINGPPTGGAGFGGTIGDLTVNSFSRAGLGDLKLYGLALGTGLTW